MTCVDIAKKLNIDPRTARKSCLFNLKKNPSPLRQSAKESVAEGGEGLGEGDVSSSSPLRGEDSGGVDNNPKEAR